MTGLIQSILQRGGWLTFALLQGICALMIVNFNTAQEKVYRASADLYLGWMNESLDDFRDYNSLGEQVDQLRAENAQLRQQLQSSLYDSESSIDTITQNGTEQRFAVIPADIISKTPLGINNFFTINKGDSALVAPHMGVIGDQGIIGIVTAVNGHYARVMTILHSQARTSVSFRGKPYFGIMVWPGNALDEMIIQAVPKHAVVAVNDTVVTSGYSHLYPADMALGVVSYSGTPQDEDNLIIKVKLFNNVADAENAYVVRDLMRPEMESLEKNK